MENHSLLRPGIRFKPTDQELVGGFLHYFFGEDTAATAPAATQHLHAQVQPLRQQIPTLSDLGSFWGGAALQLAATDQAALYFFSELKKITPKGSNVDRKMGLGGTWEGKSVPFWIEGTEGNSTCIGLKRTFWYKNEGSEDHSGWKLDEYSLFASPRKRNSHTSYDFDFVLCRLRNTSGINKRKCTTSSSQDDEAPKMKKKRANEEIEQNMHAINVVDEEGRQGNSCLTSNFVLSDQENNEFMVGDYVDYGYDDNDPRFNITADELDHVLAKEPTNGGTVEAPFPTASASEEFLLGKERKDVQLLVSSVVADGGVEDEALYTNMLEEFIPETGELPLPASSGTAEDGTVEEKAWDPSLLEQYWLSETQEEEPLNPSLYRDFMFADGGGVEEAYHPSAFDNVVDQSLFGSSYLNTYSFTEDQFMPHILM